MRILTIREAAIENEVSQTFLRDCIKRGRLSVVSKNPTRVGAREAQGAFLFHYNPQGRSREARSAAAHKHWRNRRAKAERIAAGVLTLSEHFEAAVLRKMDEFRG